MSRLPCWGGQGVHIVVSQGPKTSCTPFTSTLAPFDAGYLVFFSKFARSAKPSKCCAGTTAPQVSHQESSSLRGIHAPGHRTLRSCSASWHFFSICRALQPGALRSCSCTALHITLCNLILDGECPSLSCVAMCHCVLLSQFSRISRKHVMRQCFSSFFFHCVIVLLMFFLLSF